MDGGALVHGVAESDTTEATAAVAAGYLETNRMALPSEKSHVPSFVFKNSRNSA